MYNLLTSNFNTLDSQEIRQVILLNLLLLLAFTFSAIFCAFNFFITNNQVLVWLNILGMIVASGTFLDLYWNKNLQKSSTITVLIIIIYFILFTLLNKNDGYGLFWISSVPVFIVGLIGAKRSVIYLILYFGIIFFLAYSGIGVWQDGQWSFLGFIRLVFSSLLITLVVVMMDLALIKSYENYEKLSSMDLLTNINNRRKIQEKVSIEIQRAKRYDKDLVLILFDIDDFKKVNDTQGHKAGDEVLKSLSKEISKSLRSSDSFGRWGGEEFLIIVPEINQNDALLIAEKIRLLILDIPCTIIDNLSCSFGVAIFNKKEDSQDSLIDRADRAMYQAKHMGKNRVELV